VAGSEVDALRRENAKLEIQGEALEDRPDQKTKTARINICAVFFCLIVLEKI